MMVPGQTYKPKDSGEPLTSVPFLISRYLTHTHHPTRGFSFLPVIYAHHERIKWHLYEQRINEVELASFTPLTFSTTGGMGKFAKGRLAEKIATKTKQLYSSTITWIRCRLNFSLIRSSVSCLRGLHHNSCPRLPDSTTLAIWETRVWQIITFNLM